MTIFARKSNRFLLNFLSLKKLREREFFTAAPLWPSESISKHHARKFPKRTAAWRAMADAVMMPKQSVRCCVVDCKAAPSSLRGVTGVVVLPLRYRPDKICGIHRKTNATMIQVFASDQPGPPFFEIIFSAPCSSHDYT